MLTSLCPHLDVIFVLDLSGAGVVSALVVIPFVFVLVPLVLVVGQRTSSECAPLTCPLNSPCLGIVYPDLRLSVFVIEPFRLDNNFCHTGVPGGGEGWGG